ncbi:hypothetical protein M409DRAFT_19208 [Zasmidium cellare ATCC 36951]|uniref:Alcohol dehydrogenase-like N-terminal domain-containing protein n=1 Tax=Zasmidium cellare ATCC 36951 TaxID=1080233 RepID=A0A6A6CTK4_ZASCE|nr:uncharacterized protein M409DRAFT_19208 [Zasmidium cellare ATCC 36951]KAF2170385.1 hypothetical protein M409DRAFT_19208 [Zasmidium cellare ATCC 36951]
MEQSIPQTMHQAIIKPDLSVDFESDAPIPQLKDDEILVRAVFAGVNPIDWKGANEEQSVALHGLLKSPVHRAPGKDYVGYVVAVGKEAYQFHIGDRVMCVNHSSGFAEYSVGKTFASAITPGTVSFEDALTFGLPYLTASLLAFKDKPLPTPWNPANGNTRTPFIVYGASSSVGAFVVKLAKLANIHPIIAIAGSSAESIKSVINPSKGDVIVDYRQEEDALIRAVHQVANDAHYAADAIGSPKTGELCARLVNPHDSIVTSSVGDPWDDTLKDRVPPGVQLQIAFSPGVFEPNDPDGPDGEDSPNHGRKAFGLTAMNYLSYALQNGILAPHPYEVRANGVDALAEALLALKEGRNKGKRYLLEMGATKW